MLTNPLSAFPKEWLVTVELKQGGGRDARGNPLPPTPVTVEGCLFADRASEDPVDRSDLTEDAGVLYMPPSAPLPASTDSVVVPGRGTYAVDGKPKQWPFGHEVPLVGDHRG